MSSDADLGLWFTGFVNEMDETVEEAVRDAVDYGADVMRDLIQNAGTGHTWDESWNTLPHATPGRTQSYPGRVANGDMVSSVSSEAGHVGPNVVEGEFGWIGSAEDYWLSQEYGFHHNFTGDLIVGMYSLADATEEALDSLSHDLDRRLRNV